MDKVTESIAIWPGKRRTSLRRVSLGLESSANYLCEDTEVAKSICA